MKKRAGKDETVVAEGLINPDLVFNNDGLVVDYLTALLTATPAMSVNSGEINLVHLAMEAGWNLSGVGNAAAYTSKTYESDHAIMEAEILRTENRNLKYRSELALIDAHVLKGENDNLKVEIGGLRGRLNEMKTAFDNMQHEINELKTMMESRNVPLAITSENSNNVASQVVDTVLEADPVPVEEFDLVEDAISVGDVVLDEGLEPVDGMELVEDDVAEKEEENSDPNFVDQVVAIDGVTDREEAPDETPVSRTDIILFETDVETAPVAAVADQKQDKAYSGIAPDTAILSRVHVVDDIAVQKAAPDLAEGSHKRTVADLSIKRAKPSQKIIKQHFVNKNQSHKETTPAVKAASPNPVQHDKPAIEVERKLNNLRQQLVEDLEIKQKEEPAAQKNTLALHADDINEIDMEPAPVPKVIVRRNVKFYEDLQKEASSPTDSVVEHKIVT